MMTSLLIVICGQFVAGYGINETDGSVLNNYTIVNNTFSAKCLKHWELKGRCGVGWDQYEKSCYFFSDGEKNWDDATEDCIQRDSELVEVNDAEEDAFLQSKRVELGHANSWVGATDSDVEGAWIWSISGQTMNYSNWAPGVPSINSRDYQDCLRIHSNWDDLMCDQSIKYICEKKGVCDLNPCNNSGTCVDQGSDYACTCVNGYTGRNCEIEYTQNITDSLSVESCTPAGVEYTVYSGQANGVTYIGGTTSHSPECIKTLAGTLSESFLLNFGTCGVYPTFDTSTNSIEVRVIVQRNAVVRTGDDLIYTITCTYGEKEDVVVTAELWAKSSEVTSEIAVDIIPLPFMTLYRIEDLSSTNYIQMSNDTVVTLGTPLRQQIALDKNLPNYTLLVDTCSMEARRMPEDVLLQELLLLNNETSCSRLGDDIYPEFSYLTDNVTINGNQFVVPYALNEFEAFIPMIPIIDLVGSSVKLVISCRCSVCYGNNNACDPPTCANNRRRREAVGENRDVKSYDNLIGSFQIQIEDGKKKIIKGPNNHSTDAEVVGSLNFWAIFISAVAAVVVVVSVTGVILHMKKVKGHSGHHGDTRTSSGMEGGQMDIYPETCQ